MHGVRRRSPRSALESERELKLAALNADLIRRALALRKEASAKLSCGLNPEEYRIVEQAVEANPDEYTLWSFRREVLLYSGRQAEIPFVDLWRKELELTFRALKRHPKAYPAWQHRLWLLESNEVADLVPSEVRVSAIHDEQKLSAFMLAKDSRNFHGWAHRMRVRALMRTIPEAADGADDEKELAFVHAKINEDFANYSAWHLRSVLLPKIQNQEAQSFIKEELDLVRQAFYTDPDVQSTWFYHRWLISGAPACGREAVFMGQVLSDELATCEELLEIEPSARYALQSKAQILVRLGRFEEAKEVVNKLDVLDPMRKGYYDYLRRKCMDVPDCGEEKS